MLSLSKQLNDEATDKCPDSTINYEISKIMGSISNPPLVAKWANHSSFQFANCVSVLANYEIILYNKVFQSDMFCATTNGHFSSLVYGESSDIYASPCRFVVATVLIKFNAEQVFTETGNKFV